MADDGQTREFDDSTEQNSPDPLGILGWKVGGKYVIRTYIGGGGFGEVYEGYNQNLPDQRLVFKFFKRVQSRSKFDKEARILCLLDHPNISRVIDYLPEEGAVVVAYIDGRDGREILKEQGALSEELFMKVARALSDAIAYAHEKKIAHRDLKPGNIMFDKNNHVYLIDFGIAKEVGEAATKTAYQALTPMFAAPERQQGDIDYNPFLSDIFEAGVTLYNFATNDLPYRNPANPNFNDWGGEAARKLNPDLRLILRKATHPDPEQRYKTAREMADDIKKLRTAFGGESAGKDTAGKKKRSLVLPVILVLIAAAVVAGYFGRDRIKEIIQDLTASRAISTEETGDDLQATIDSILADSGQAADSAAQLAAVDSAAGQKPIRSESADQETSATAGSESTRDDSKAVAVKDATTTEPKKEEPPKPKFMTLTVDVVPTGVSYVTINGDSAAVTDRFRLKPGKYTVKVFHREFPIYTETVSLSQSPRKVYADLGSKFGGVGSANLQVALSPPSSDLIVELTFNGKGHTLTEFPVFDLIKMKGRWFVDASAFAVGSMTGKPRVDSLVTFPYGGADRSRVKGRRGEIDLRTADDQTSTIPLLIYWSKK